MSRRSSRLRTPVGPGAADAARTGNPRPLVLVGSILAGTVLVAGVGTLHAEAARAATTPAGTASSTDAADAADPVTDVQPMGDGPHGAHLVRVLTAAGREAYVITDSDGLVRSVRVVSTGEA